MDKCVQMFDKELWRLGPDGTGERKRTEKLGENGRKEKGEETEGENRRDGERKGLSPGLEWKDDERRWRGEWEYELTTPAWHII
ncbi:hypothetical protein TNCV_3580771 [Trichonephila clavipes]|nr:hypothetical protein TNCV_3580771 [Trichonephila clavipes]